MSSLDIKVLSALFLVIVLAISARLYDLSKEQDAKKAMMERIDSSRRSLDSATARERLLRDSIELDEQLRERQFANYVRDLEAMHEGELRAAVRKAAARSRRETDLKLSDSAVVGKDSAECHLSVPCSEVVALLSGDSLLRTNLDSLNAQLFLQAATCSTRTAEVAVQRDSLCLAQAPAAAPREPWWKRAQVLATVAVLSALVGAVAAN